MANTGGDANKNAQLQSAAKQRQADAKRHDRHQALKEQRSV